MRIKLILVVVVILMNTASADIIRGIEIDFVTIGNAGNIGDTRTEIDNDNGYPFANPYGCGSVGYEYQIGKYEVTNSQWDAFVATAGTPTGNPSYAYDETADHTGANIPTDRASWLEAAQFCNYLTSGDKSQGAYLFSGDNTNPSNFLGIDRNAAVSAYGIIYVIPTEDEWYKAAYYKSDGSGYSTYANGTDIAPLIGETCYGYPYPWNVGTGIMEQNGTFDMMGNVWEWNETLLITDNRGIRGGYYASGAYNLRSSHAEYISMYDEGVHKGFRIASIPEPATLLLLTFGGLFLGRRK